LFEIEEYGLSDKLEILCSLEHGNVIMWRHLWNRLNLGRTIRQCVSQPNNRIKIAVDRYVEMMVINRCINPLSKLATSRWMDTTCYRQMKGYADLSREVQYFYRSMDYLLKAKERIEKAVYQHLHNLFSVNVRLTFYDITSTFFYGGNCPLADNGYSRDMRPDKVQVVIGVVTSYEGYPLKHYVFEGNKQDQSTVREVVENLRREYNIEETVFVGDRGMISRLNLDKITEEGYDYIMGVKLRQDEMMAMLLEDTGLFRRGVIKFKDLKIVDRRISVKTFMLWKIAIILELSARQKQSAGWNDFKMIINALDNKTNIGLNDLRENLKQLGVADTKKRQRLGRFLKKYEGRYEETVRLVCVCNPERKKVAARRRKQKLKELSKQLDQLIAKQPKNLLDRMAQLFTDHNRIYRRFFKWDSETTRQKATTYDIDQEAIEHAKLYDGVFVLRTSRNDLSAEEVVSSYKNLQEVETLFDDLKHFVDVHPVRHWLSHRVQAHVFLCVLSLLLKRVLEIDCLKSKALTETLETVAQSKLVNYRVFMSERSNRTKEFWKITKTTPQQAHCFALAGIENPESLQEFAW